MTLCTADFETGVNGATIATSDAGSATAWDTVVIDGSGAIIYDNTHVHTGTLAMKETTWGSSSTTGTGVLWTAAGGLGTVTDHYGRIYLYLTGFPSATLIFMQFPSQASRNARFQISTSGLLAFVDSPASGALSGSVPVATNQWIRIEWHIIHSTTVGQMELKLFNNAESTTPSETITGTSTYDTGTSAGGVQIGSIGNTPDGFVYWLDDIVAGATSYPGPDTTDYTYHDTVLADGPWLYWRLDDLAGTIAGDYSGNARVGTYSGGPTLAQLGLITEGTSVFFDATNDYALSSSAIFNSSTATVEVWFDYDGTPPSVGNRVYVAGCTEGDGGGVGEKLLYIDSNSRVVWYVYDGSGQTAQGSTVLTAGRYHLVGTVNGSVATLYVDGVADGTSAASGSYAAYANPNVLVGGLSTALSNMGRKAGRRDEFALYTTDLSAARILAHYQAGLGISPVLVQQPHVVLTTVA